jgi:hypothetical protein
VCSVRKAWQLLSRWFLASLSLGAWRWKRYVPPKHRFTFNGLHGVVSQKIVRFVATAVRTLDPAESNDLSLNVFTRNVPVIMWTVVFTLQVEDMFQIVPRRSVLPKESAAKKELSNAKSCPSYVLCVYFQEKTRCYSWTGTRFPKLCLMLRYVLRQALIHKWIGPASTPVDVARWCTEDAQTRFLQQRRIMSADRIWHLNSVVTVMPTLDRDLLSEASYGLHLKQLRFLTSAHHTRANLFTDATSASLNCRVTTKGWRMCCLHYVTHSRLALLETSVW